MNGSLVTELGKSSIVGLFSGIVASLAVGSSSPLVIGTLVLVGLVCIFLGSYFLEYVSKLVGDADLMRTDEMPRLTITLTDEQAMRIEELSGDDGPYDSKSEAVRNLIQDGERVDELENEIERLRSRLDSREDRIDELEEQLARRSQVEEKVDTLAKRVEDDDAPFFIRWYRWYQRRD